MSSIRESKQYKLIKHTCKWLWFAAWLIKVWLFKMHVIYPNISCFSCKYTHQEHWSYVWLYVIVSLFVCVFFMFVYSFFEMFVLLLVKGFFFCFFLTCECVYLFDICRFYKHMNVSIFPWTEIVRIWSDTNML